jgi:hypothetical protein
MAIQRNAVQSEMGSPRQRRTSQYRLILWATLEALQNQAAPTSKSAAGQAVSESDRQTLAAFGATGINDGAAAPGFHADQKAVSARATDLGGLVSAFHFGNPKRLKSD